VNATGIVRRLDQLGRISIPKEIRDTKGLDNGAGVEIFTDGNYLILRKYCPECIFCGSLESVRNHKGKPVCSSCLAKVTET
jgi:transcriptional pleiotropic regulator of transition state genes